MARILKNKTSEECFVTHGTRSVGVSAGDQVDLSDFFALFELASSDSLIELLGQGTSKYVLNDGSRDLSVSEAFDLIRGFSQKNPISENGTPVFEPLLPSGRRCDFYTPNFCDRTTWYQDSLRVENEVLVDNGSHQIFNLATPCFVADLKHGKVFAEDELVEEYGTVVKVNDVIKTENKPGKTDGDFSINYSTGAVTFNSPLAEGVTVKLTYSKTQTSLFKVKPPTGKKLRIGYVEVQYSKNIGLTDTLIFQLWGLADVFAPGQFPPGTLIPISGPEKYKTISDFICDAEKSYPIIPTFGQGDSWRMMTQERVIFRFDYTQRASTDIISSAGMEIRIWLENDVPFNGEYAVGTFYGIRVEE